VKKMLSGFSHTRENGSRWRAMTGKKEEVTLRGEIFGQEKASCRKFGDFRPGKQWKGPEGEGQEGVRKSNKKNF